MNRDCHPSARHRVTARERDRRIMMRFETLMWTLCAAWAGVAMFATWGIGVLVGACVGLLHGGAQKRRGTAPALIWGFAVIPAIGGLALAATVTLAWIIVVPLIGGLWWSTACPMVPRGRRMMLTQKLCGLVAIAVTVIACAVRPSYWERDVGPFSYPTQRLDSLASQLARDHGIVIDIDPRVGNTEVAFILAGRVSRLEAGRRLAELAGRRIHYSISGTLTSVLGGPHVYVSID